MPLQMQHGTLLQFADDICLICGGDNYEHVQICDDLSTFYFIKVDQEQ